jgi:hypothetical protein
VALGVGDLGWGSGLLLFRLGTGGTLTAGLEGFGGGGVRVFFVLVVV